MKFISYLDKQAQWGVAVGENVVSGSRLLNGEFNDLQQVIAAGKLELAAQQFHSLDADLKLNELKSLPPITNPSQIFCAGLNYAAHASETGNDAPQAPRFFSRVNSSIIGHKQPLIRPKVSSDFDFEGELMLIIGKAGRHIKPENALNHIAGYTCFMDGSVRDWQKDSVTAGKNFHHTGAIGPWMVPSFELTDPTKLTLITRVNGMEVQKSTTDLLIHTIPKIIAYLSAITPLLPGDYIATGTPEGIGCRREPPLWLKDGDQVEVEISEIGILSNSVIDEA